MIKKILAFSLTLNIILTGVTAFAVPSSEYVFYDNDDSELYIFGKYDKRDNVASDVGIFANGKKFSYAKDGNTEHLEKQNESVMPRFGIGLKAPKTYFGKVDIYPYADYTDGLSMTGDTVTFDAVNDKITSPKPLLFENFTEYNEGKVFVNNDRIDVNRKIIVRKNSNDNVTELSLIKEKDFNQNEKNMLKINDNSTSYGQALEILVPDYERVLTFEIRFKLNKTTTVGNAFHMTFYGDDEKTKQAFSIDKSSSADSGLYYTNNDGTTTFTGGADMDDGWFTMKVRMDTLLKQTAISLASDVFSEDLTENLNKYNYVWQDTLNKKVIAYNKPWYNEYDAQNIKRIYIQTASGTCGDYYIDYIKLGEGGEEIYPTRTRAKSQPYNTIPDPKPRY